MIDLTREAPKGPRGYESADFERRFLEICDEHRSHGRALAFVFLWYDFRKPQILKVLRDGDYWRALDHISGSYLTTFSIRAAEPADDYVIEQKGMDGITGVHDPGRKYQLLLRSYFPISGRLALPALLFFQVHQGEVVACGLWELRLEFDSLFSVSC